MSHRRTWIVGAVGGMALVLGPTAAGAAGPRTDVAKPQAQWPLTFFQADKVWAITQGANVTVGLVDSGVSPLGDTTANLLAGADFSSGPTSIGPAHLDTDTDSHGTTMAVLIAGTGTGIGLKGLAPQAKILPVRMQKETGEDPDKITEAIEYATAQGVKVINMSLGTTPTSALSAAVKAAEDKDIVVVAAAGNWGTNRVIAPASLPGVIAVAAIDSTGSRWSQSSYGSQVALAAPGVAIPVENAHGVLTTARGTSEATAYVTASVALVRSLHPDWTAGQTIRALLATATKAGGSTGLARNDRYGYGIVNPLAALGAAAPAAKDDPLLAGAAPLAAAVPATATPSPTPTPTVSASATATPSATPSAAPSPTIVAQNAADSSAKKSGLLTGRRTELLVLAGGVAFLGIMLFVLNSALKKRRLRKNRAW